MTEETCHGQTLVRVDDRAVIDCERCGFAHVFPMYTDSELVDFYENHYAESTPSHLFDLKVYNVNRMQPVGSVLDIGCWTGSQLEAFQKSGWDCHGTELNRNAADEAMSKGFRVRQMSIESLFENAAAESYDVVNASYILEHIPRPGEFLSHVATVVADDGILIIEVPNEFNPLQKCYLKHTGSTPYWIALPDHVNYFTPQGLETLIAKTGWKISLAQTSFPMEMFLLMGDDYRNAPELGPKCFRKVVAMETAIMKTDLRLLSDWYTALYPMAIGRSLIYYLRKQS